MHIPQSRRVIHTLCLVALLLAQVTSPVATLAATPSRTLARHASASQDPQGIASITRVSVAADGTQATEGGSVVSIADDGRTILFASRSEGLVPGHDGAGSSLYLRDLRTGEMRTVSLGPAGEPANGASSSLQLSGNGRYLVFSSRATNLVPDDTNEMQDIFVHDLETGETTRVSVGASGEQGNHMSSQPAISADGRYVAFVSAASNLVPGDTNSCGRLTDGHCEDVFVHDLETGETSLVSLLPDGTQFTTDMDPSSRPDISDDGRTVVFSRWAPEFGDVDRIYVRDRQAGTTTIASVDTTDKYEANFSWAPSVSGDGRYVAFLSKAPVAISGEENDCVGGPAPGQPCPHVYVRDRETGELTRVSVNSSGFQAMGGYASEPAISADGRYVVFVSTAGNLVSSDTNGDCAFRAGAAIEPDRCRDVFVHDRQERTTQRVSVSGEGDEANGESYGPVMSGNGAYVAFTSMADNLVPGDTNESPDAFVVTLEPDTAQPAGGSPVEELRPQPTAVPETATASGRIALIGDDRNVWLISADGTGAQQITSDAHEERTPTNGGESYISQWTKSYHSPKWSPSGRRLAVVMRDETGDLPAQSLVLYDVVNDRVTVTLDAIGAGYDWAPDGQTIVYADPSTNRLPPTPGLMSGEIEYTGLYEHNLDSGESRLLVPPLNDSSLAAPVYAPTGNTLLFQDQRGAPEFLVWRIATADVTDPVTVYTLWDEGDYGAQPTCSWAPSGSEIACFDGLAYAGPNIGPDVHIAVHDASGYLLRVLPTHEGSCDTHALWSPDGAHIAVRAGVFDSDPMSVLEVGSYVDILDPNGETRRRIAEGRPLDWSPDARSLLVRADDRNDSGMISVVSAETGEAQPLMAGLDAAWQPGLAIASTHFEDHAARKQQAVESLEHIDLTMPTLPWVGAHITFDESQATELMATLRQQYDDGTLTPETAEAFYRLMLQEEAIAKLAPIYVDTSEDLAAVTVDSFLTLVTLVPFINRLGLPKDREMRLALEVERKVLSLVEDARKVSLLYGINEEAVTRFFDAVLVAARAVADPYILGLETAVEQVAAEPATAKLIEEIYVSDVQLSLDRGVYSVDATWSEMPYSDIWQVAPSDELAGVQAETLVEEAAIWARNAHLKHQDFTAAAAVAQLMADVISLGEALPHAKVIEVLVQIIDHLGINASTAYTTWTSLRCTRDISLAVGDRVFLPDQQYFGCRDRTSGASRVRLAKAHFPADPAAWDTASTAAHAEADAYRDAVGALLSALDEGDSQAIDEALVALDLADLRLGEAMEMTDHVVAATEPPESVRLDLLDGARQFQLDSLQLTLILAVHLALPEPRRDAIDLEKQAALALSNLNAYVETVEELTPVGGTAQSLPFVGSVRAIDKGSGDGSGELNVVVRNLGRAATGDLVVGVSPLSGTHETQTLGSIVPNGAVTVTLALGQPITDTLTVRASVWEDGHLAHTTLAGVRGDLRRTDSDEPGVASVVRTVLIVAGVGALLALVATAVVLFKSQGHLSTGVVGLGCVAIVLTVATAIAGGVFFASRLGPGRGAFALLSRAKTETPSAAVPSTTAPATATGTPAPPPQPTETLTPSPVPPTDTPQPTETATPDPLVVCAGAPQQGIQVGNRIYVCTDPDHLILRDRPGRGAGEIDRLPFRTPLMVVGGPVCADGILWWEVEADGGRIGWVMEGSDAVDPQFLCLTQP